MSYEYIYNFFDIFFFKKVFGDLTYFIEPCNPKVYFRAYIKFKVVTVLKNY